MVVKISDRPPVTVVCECSLVGKVADLEAAVVWAFHEALRHGPNSRFRISIEIVLDVENLHGISMSGPT